MSSSADAAATVGTTAGESPASQVLTVTVVQPPMDSETLAEAIAVHAATIRAATSRVVVFPELSLTGYNLAADAVDVSDPLLGDLVASCGENGSVALVGAPVREADREFIATLVVDGKGVTVAYRKCWLGPDEQVRFSAGSGPSVLELDGWRIGHAICKDTGVDDHTDALADMGIDLYAAGVVHHAGELGEQRRRVERIAERCGAYVALASCAGATGGGYDETAGHSVIWDPAHGSITEADAEPGSTVKAALPLLAPRPSAN